MKWSLKKKNSVLGLSDAGVALTITTVTLAIGAYIVSQVNTSGNFAANSAAANVTTLGQAALQTMANFLGIVAIAIVFSVVIALLFRGLGGAFRGGGGTV